MNDVEFLKENKKYLLQAESNYVTGLTTKKVLRFKEIYTRMGGHISNINCPSCVLNMLKKIYNKYKDELE